jgi:hypothetical protein
MDNLNSYAETRAFLTDLYASYATGDIGPTLDAMADDIIFEYVGPPEIFPFCGERQGKVEMLARQSLEGFRNIVGIPFYRCV